MATVSAPPVSSAPIITCPYTAGGCPLFNTIDIPQSSASACAGSCAPSPAPAPPPSTSTASSTPSSSAATPSLLPSRPSVSRASSSLNSIGYDDALLFSGLQSDVPLPLPSALLKQDGWSSYLDFAVSPGPSNDLPAYFTPPLPEPPSTSTSTSAGASSSSSRGNLAPSSKHNLWDIEELVPPEGSYNSAKRTRLTPPPSAPQPGAYGYGGDINVALSTGAVESGAHSPTASSDEEKEVITPFISKLTYLLEHAEYQPWVRWDASGNHILIAHTKPHLLEILARYFRHTTVASFVRQLNIYGFKRASTSSLLSILDTVSFPSSVSIPGHPEPETFSAADYSAFSNSAFFRSLPGGRHCRLGSLKPITKERGPRNRSKKAQAAAAAAAAKQKKLEQGSDGESA
ncbi:hypothetical protein JCM8547_008840 [Rhodosporidiobolus lusitaniae]